jgi:hypothetical protein
MMDVQPAMRSNADYIILTKEKSGVLREKIYKNWGSCLSNLRVFSHVMDKATQDFGCLIIDNKNNSSSRISDSIARFKGDYELAESPFRMGSAPFWAFSHSAGIGEDEIDNDEEPEPSGGDAFDGNGEAENMDDDQIDDLERALQNIKPNTKIRVRRVARGE